MDLRFLRHAESIGNATHDCSTDAHDRLSERGRTQAEALIGRLHGLPLEIIYCSPLERAKGTIEPYIKASGKHMEIWPDLAEINGDKALTHEALDQLKRAVQKLCARHQGQPHKVLIVSHGHLLSRMLEHLLGLPLIGRFQHANTGISRIEETENHLVVRYLNRVPDSSL